MATARETLYNDGEALDYTDLNEMQRFMRAQLYDGVLAPLSRGSDIDYNGDLTLGGSALRTLGNAAAPSITGSSLVVTVGPGWIAHSGGGGISAGNYGTDANFLQHYVGGSEDTLTYTSGAADATNPRWDILQAKIDMLEGGAETRDFKDATTGVLSSQSLNKTRRTRFTASIKAGTAAASPTEPSPDAGYVKLFAWRIEALATAITAANFRDYRLPIGFRVVDVLAGEAVRTTGWTVGSDGLATADGGGVRSVVVNPQMGAPWRTGRLIAIGATIAAVAGSTATALIRHADYADTPTTGNSTLLDVSSQMVVAADGGKFRGLVLTDQAIWMDGTNAPTVQGANDFSVLGISTVATTLHKLYFIFNSGATHADSIGLVRFYIAGM